jgi:hypothetical protein
MNTDKVRDILVDMLVVLDEFKCQDMKYHEIQVARIMKYIKSLEGKINE